MRMNIGEMKMKTLRQRLEVRVLLSKYSCNPEFTIHTCHMSCLGFTGINRDHGKGKFMMENF